MTMRMLVHHHILVFILVLSFTAEASDELAPMPIGKPGCRTNCSGISIQYPFGIGQSVGEDCFYDVWFQIDCNQSTGWKPVLRHTQLEIGNITIAENADRVQVYSPVTSLCPNTEAKQPRDFTGSPFVYSQKFNRFTAVSCGFLAVISSDELIVGGCRSRCRENGYSVDTPCDTGDNCCQTTIPSSLTVINASIQRDPNGSAPGGAGCKDRAFLVDQDWFTATSYYAIENMSSVPVVLEWTLNNDQATSSFQPFQSFLEDTEWYYTDPTPFCSIDQSISNRTRTTFSCYCSSGFEGNPYLLAPCRDIDECAIRPSVCSPGSKCVNHPAMYYCGADSHVVKWVLSGVGGCVGMLLLLTGAWLVYKYLQKRKNKIRKELFFKRNGGLLLQQQLSSGEVNVEKIRLFTSEELEKSTDKFNIDRILGQGGQGTVYKGMLTDGRIVAIKKSKIVSEGQLSDFINEVVILSQINHRNVVQLLGCCLENEVPLLVYEFIPNGTLSKYIQGQIEEFPLTWKIRLRIATEIAGALFYLHSAASFPIFHRDIKSTNILLDEKYRAKVADFGTSRSVGIDQTHLTTCVLGTFGYMDPEYFHSSQFTEKSDVYSFGVVLVELLTGQKPVSAVTKSQEEFRNLASHFITSMQEDSLYEILDARVLKEGSETDIKVVANLAKRCLNVNGRNRPTMREVTAELESIHIHMFTETASNADQRSKSIDSCDGSSIGTGIASDRYDDDEIDFITN
ncbi:wall-associated receptor kinase-like 1 [Rosa sericea]